MRAVHLLFSLPLVLFSSCEKSITLVPRKSANTLVVEATIESGIPPMVILSGSLDYFSKIDPAALEASYVHGATVSISDGVRSHLLSEFKVPDSNGYFRYYYSVDTGTNATPFTGELNKAYSLRITVGPTTYTAATTLPVLSKTIDSIWWEPAPFDPDSTRARLMVKVTDPPGYGNYIRYFTRANNEAFLPGLNSVFDDQIIDGTTYVVQVDRGVDRNKKIDLEGFNFFKRGDTVAFKICNIDKATYDFWRTMEYSYASIGNPFSSPAKVIGNISGGALGYFGGYASRSFHLAIPR